MSSSPGSSAPIYTITVGQVGTITNESTVDISTKLNAEIAAAPAGDAIVIDFEPGDYGDGNPILLPSNTSVIGNDATLTYIPDLNPQTNWGMFVNADDYSIGNSSGQIVDSQISVKGMTFIINNAHIFSTWFINANNIDVQDNVFIGGVDGTALTSVIDSVVANNVNFGMDNAAQDAWNGPVNVTFEDNSDYVYGTTGVHGAGPTGWNVLLNASTAHLGYAGDAVQYGIAAGDAVNDAAVENLLSTNWAYGGAVNADALLTYGYTTESQITQQGNVSQGLGVSNTDIAYTSSPITGSVVEDEAFIGLIQSVDYGFSVIGNWNADAGLSNETSNSTVVGNLIVGLTSDSSESVIQNNGINSTTTNNAILNESATQAVPPISPASDGPSSLSDGNLVNSGASSSGSGILPDLNIVAPPTVFATADAAFPISGISIADITGSSTISATLTTTFGTLSLPPNIADVTHTTVLGQSAVIITGDLGSVNAALSELSYTTNSGGWDDAIEINVLDSSGITSTRYIPVLDTASNSVTNELVTITPGELLPELYYTTIAPISTLSADTVVGVQGNNLITMGTTVSVVFLDTGNDTIIGGSVPGYITTGEGLAVVDLTGGGDESISGGAGLVTVNASAGNNVFAAGASDALFQGGTGSNTVVGGLGNLTVQGATGALYLATLPEDGGNMTVTLGAGNSTVYALSGNTHISSAANTANLIHTGIGSTLIQSAGNDALFMGAGITTVDARSGGSDTVIGGTGSLDFIAGTELSVIAPAATTTISAGGGNLIVLDGGSFDLKIDFLAASSRDIVLPGLSNNVVLENYNSDAIAYEFLSGSTLSIKLNDGTNIQWIDPTFQAVSLAEGTLSYLPEVYLAGKYYIDIDDLPGIDGGNGSSDTAIIEAAISGAPAGYQAVLISNQGLVIDGTLGLDPTSLILDGPLTGNGVVDVEEDSQLALNGSVASTETIAFTGDHGFLILGDVNNFSGTVAGLKGSVTIDVSSLRFDTLGSVFVTENDLLDIVENGSTASVQLMPNQSYSDVVFHLFSDGLNGTDVSENTVACFLAGTFIRTPLGEKAIETLRIGELVLNVQGEEKRIKWIGRRSYRKPVPGNFDITPILVKTGALEDNVPDHDLFISPMHGISVGSFLIPAGALVNGQSIRAFDEHSSIDYFHILTEEHDIILANNTPVETFIDEGSIQMFENAYEFYQLYPDAAMAVQLLRAPRLECGPELERIRRKIALRAGILLGHVEKASVIGFLESADRHTIIGWAYSPDDPFRRIHLEILDAGAVLARIVAQEYRPDVKRAGFGPGYCGFSIRLPGPLPAMRRHEISVRVYGSSDVLTGSPVVIDAGITHDIVKTDSLTAMINAAITGATDADELSALGDAFFGIARRLREISKTSSQLPPPKMGKSTVSGSEVVLILDICWPTVSIDAGSNALVSHILAFLALGFLVEFCATSGPPATALEHESLQSLKKLGVVCYGSGDDLQTTEAILLKASASKVAFVYLHRMATANRYIALVRLYLPRAKVIYSVADLHHLRLLRQAQVTDRPDLFLKARSVRATEFYNMQVSDCVITHSIFEAEYIKKNLPHVNVHVVTWVVSGSTRFSPKKATGNIAFVGSAAHPPNLDALEQLANNIMPEVWKKKPSVKCLVAGAGWTGKQFAGLDQRIVCAGHQQSLKVFFDQVAVTVAPLRFGAGIKGKVIDSMANGIPCAMSEIAAEGLDLNGPLRSVVTNELNLPNQIIKLLDSQKYHGIIARSGLEFTKKHFCHTAVNNAMARAIGLRPGKFAQLKFSEKGTRCGRIQERHPSFGEL